MQRSLIILGRGAVALILDYPDGTQVAVPERAVADGQYSYRWPLPINTHGTVHIIVDGAASIAQGTFTNA
jgi:hypothetical protein